jgi:Pregnancy-associated plasma protein-A
MMLPFRSAMIVFCCILMLACTRKAKPVMDMPIKSTKVKQTTDSLYGGITPMGQIEKDRAFMLDLLRRFGHADDLKHIQDADGYDMHYIVFPLRVVDVQQQGKPGAVTHDQIRRGVAILNEALKDAWIQFRITEIGTLKLNENIQTLKEDDYQRYFDLSHKYDKKDTCTLYLLDNQDDLCRNFSCSRTYGFANILDSSTNNVVLDKFFLDNHKVIVHEFGHYFGLYHTADRTTFGVEAVDGSNCRTNGDRICDTPADPGELYSVYVNYSDCYMDGLREPETDLMYHPMINNYMSYYYPCYMRKYLFSRGQLEVILNAAVKVRRNQIIGLAEFPL